MDPTAEALAEALSAEHAAVYGFEFVGGAGDEGRRERASSAALEHKALRDALREAALERDLEAPPAAASYPIPEGRSGEDMDAFAAGLEGATVEAYLWLTASPDTDLRITAARALQEATLRSLRWGAPLDVLPGFERP
ncbi:ferritin-like domain-containing protein [Nocardiopsis sp. MG754419]|uniref:ferritin-like domain-containing protein n=1 Tax=Nocardiopsis sp. MG754419 TaxID=2259865 RepID=UPI001BAA9C1B|nr:ferritin-like domain-containing protein [Nocardiopsis sp. MG754419]MBR8743812.1 DUF4439 domain-containing protein [Nocardiopsis sp. MG754419]